MNTTQPAPDATEYRRILLVEDEHDIAGLIKHTLERSGDTEAYVVGSGDAVAACRPLAAEARRLGAVQDRALSNCRMAARWLREQARMLAEDEPQMASWAEMVRARAQGTLEAKK